jgi:hypothetical protein
MEPSALLLPPLGGLIMEADLTKLPMLLNALFTPPVMPATLKLLSLSRSAAAVAL